MRQFFSGEGTLVVDREPALRLHTIGRGVLQPSPPTTTTPRVALGALDGRRAKRRTTVANTPSRRRSTCWAA